MKRRFEDRCMVPKNHWLDHAEIKYGREFVNESKSIVNLIVLLSTFPVFWALVQQQSSRWVFQASKMDGDFGLFSIKPDQLGVLIPFFNVILVPIFEKFIFPLIAKIGIKSLLQRVACGMVLASVAFIMSAYLEAEINKTRISMLYLIPQYILIAAAEALVWVAGISFAYTHAPTTMKSIINSLLYLTTAGGNLIVFIISGVELFESQMMEFVFFALLRLIDTLIFVFLTIRFKKNEMTNESA
jgi:dipeptide/tripeptide permease